MNCIKIITDADFGLEVKDLKDPTIRLASRGIVENDKGEIALFFKSKMNEYKLPGGGLDPNETPEVGFIREVLEEVGYNVKILKKLGYTEEIKSQKNWKQISHVFVGKTESLGKQELTEKELAEGGGEIIWVSPEKAVELINYSIKNVKGSPYDKLENKYSTNYVVLRDKYILDYYLKEKNNSESVVDKSL